MKISSLYTDFNKELLSIYDSREAANISDLVFEHVTGLKKWQRQILRDTDEKNFVSEDQLNETRRILLNLLTHKPLQYILHEAWFHKMKFFVDEHVLIPRPETEELVETVIEHVKSSKAPLPYHILDIGTGSGCIAVSLKKALPETSLTAVDVSLEALRVAEKNALEHECLVQFQQLDFLNACNWPQLKKYHIIVSNPPYIPIAEKEILDKNVSEHEPSCALFVENESPFIFYEKIARFAKSHLHPEGMIFLEVHEMYAAEVAQVLQGHGFRSQIKQDMTGRDRMIIASL